MAHASDEILQKGPMLSSEQLYEFAVVADTVVDGERTVVPLAVLAAVEIVVLITAVVETDM